MKFLTNFLIIFFLFFVMAYDVSAQKSSWLMDKNVLGSELIPEGCRKGRQPQQSDPLVLAEPQLKCGFEEIIQTFINITRLILGVMGSLALFMFTYGGLKFILSLGNSDKIKEAKTVLANAAIGIILILGAWTIVNLIVLASSLGRKGLGSTGQIFEQEITTPPVK